MAGRKLTKNQRETLKQLVLESQLKRFHSNEALAYISERLGTPIGIDYYNKVKAHLRNEIGKRLEILMKDRYAYIAQYFERIDELRSLQRDLHTLCKNNVHNPVLQKSCITELHAITLSINSLYELLPELAELQLYNNERYQGPQLATKKDDSEYSGEAKF